MRKTLNCKKTLILIKYKMTYLNNKIYKMMNNHKKNI